MQLSQDYHHLSMNKYNYQIYKISLKDL